MWRSRPTSRAAGGRRRWGGALLLPPAGLAVHQLRYLLAFGRGTGAELQRTGHSYLHSVVPWIVLLLALAAGAFLRSLGQALGGRVSRPRRTFSFAGLWLACAVCLAAIFACQEFLEGVFATGHATGLPGIFSYGGWWAIAAAVGVGLVVAACLYGTAWVLEQVARRRTGWTGTGRCRTPRLGSGQRGVLSAPAPLVDGWSDRGPPRCDALA